LLYFQFCLWPHRDFLALFKVPGDTFKLSLSGTIMKLSKRITHTNIEFKTSFLCGYTITKICDYSNIVHQQLEEWNYFLLFIHHFYSFIIAINIFQIYLSKFFFLLFPLLHCSIFYHHTSLNFFLHACSMLLYFPEII